MTSELKTKKRKHVEVQEEPSSKRSKTDKAGKEKVAKEKSKLKTKLKEAVKDKGKARADGEFTVVKASLSLSIPPVFANNLRAGAEEMLDSMVMRYVIFITHPVKW